MPNIIRNKYHVAINSVGYMLRGAPNTPAYTRSVVPSQVSRLAISDLAYSDFAGTGLFYLAQTDWSAGIKTESVWRDDAKYYYSTNLDTYSAQGEIKVEKEVALNKTFDEDVYCGASLSVAGVTTDYIGTYKTAGGNIKIYKHNRGNDTWADIAGTALATSQNSATYLLSHKEYLWVGTAGIGNADCVDSFDGTNWVDHQTAIDTATGWQAKASRAACEVGGTLYVGVDDYLNNTCAIVSTIDSGANWVVVKNFGYEAFVVSMADYNSKLYYLLYDLPVISLRVYDPVAALDTLVETFNVSSFSNTGVWDKCLKIFNGKLIITLPTKILEYDGSNLSEIYKIDPKKTAIGYEADANLYYGCVQKESLLYWGNLIYDGTNFFNFKKPSTDITNRYLYPVFLDSSDILFYSENISGDESLYTESANNYKPTTAKNFIVFSEMAPVVSIDKLLYSITAIFEKLISGDEIKIEYSLNNRATWTTAGTLTYASEGGTNVKRELIIPNSILFSKIWWKVSMANTNGTSSPVLLDLIMAYRPMPHYKNRWQMRLNFSDGVKLLNKQNDYREGDDLNSQLWNEKLTKKQVKFQDIDYVECIMKTAMTKTQVSASITAIKKIPLQGRIRAVSGAVSEEMYYTSAKTDRILGITRGARGTTARAYLSGQVLDNGYDVYVDDIATTLNFTDEEKTESIAQVLLIES